MIDGKLILNKNQILNYNDDMNFTQSQIRELKSALKDKTLIPYPKRIQVVYFRSLKMTYFDFH